MILPLLRFHVAVGARLAMRTLVPVIAAAFGAGMLFGSDFLTSLARIVFGERSSGGSAVLIAVVLGGAALEAAPRVCRGLDGWLRHLPVSGLAHRRAAGLALAVAQAPLVIALLVLASFVTRAPLPLLQDLLGLALASLAAGLFAAPSQRRWLASPLALGAILAAGMGTWTAMALGLGLLTAADAAAGPLARTGPAASRLPQLSDHPGGGWTGFRLAWRALRWSLIGAGLLGLLPVGAAFAFVTNNALAPEHVRLGARFGAGLAVVLLLAQIAESLAVRRPAWPWSRSLPWSASQRVVSDAAFLGLHALPLVALAALVHPAALAALGFLPLLAVRAAGAMRRAPERRTGAAGEVLLEGSLLSALVALLPWTALLALAALPWAVRAAAERDRRQKVSRWLELHHLAVGDPQSWSAS